MEGGGKEVGDMEDASPSDFSFAFLSPQFSDCTLCLHTDRGTTFSDRGDSELGTGWCSISPAPLTDGLVHIGHDALSRIKAFPLPGQTLLEKLCSCCPALLPLSCFLQRLMS